MKNERREEVNRMYEYEDVFDAYDREPYEGHAEEAMEEGKREQQPDGSFIWVD